jgi:hypothetical protein
MGKEKKIKTKETLLSQKGFSNIYKDLFNNNKYSDFKIKFEKSGESFFAHKFILYANSQFFEEQNSDTFTFPKEDDEETAKTLIKFYYDGFIDIGLLDSEKIISFTLLATKYKTKTLKELKLPAKLLLNGVISYVEKDLSNRFSIFDSLIECVNNKIKIRLILKKW